MIVEPPNTPMRKMPVTKDTSAPYAPAGVILSLLERNRTKGLPAPITAEVLTRAGVTDSLNSRTLQALQALDLIDDVGQPTKVLDGLRLAPEAEYKTRMAEWLYNAYADALNFVDPAKATETEIRDAFRGYKPVGQQDRMVTLFVSLLEAAGVMPERTKKPRQKLQSGAPTRQPQQRAKVAEPEIQPAATPTHHRRVHVETGLPPALSGLLQSLPPQGDGWTKTQRDLFVTTFTAVLDFCYPVGQQKDRYTDDVE